MPGAGRFAPSPTGSLHLGNLRTALVAWCLARSTGRRFLVRVEDLDPGAVKEHHVAEQLDDLAAIGLDWDPPVVRQSERADAHRAALDTLIRAGLTYRCWCTRREIREAAAAPHGPAGTVYPGSCRDLTPAEVRAREQRGRHPAVRLRSTAEAVTFTDEILGEVSGTVDDLVLCRRDGVVAYHLAVVVDDAAAGVDQVVRGDDLAPSTPGQVHLAQLLGLAVPTYAHVPLALGPDGSRLAKRDGAVTLADLAEVGVDAGAVRSQLVTSLGLCVPGEMLSPRQLLDRFEIDRLPRQPWVPDQARS